MFKGLIFTKKGNAGGKPRIKISIARYDKDMPVGRAYVTPICDFFQHWGILPFGECGTPAHFEQVRRRSGIRRKATARTQAVTPSSINWQKCRPRS